MDRTTAATTAGTATRGVPPLPPPGPRRPLLTLGVFFAERTETEYTGSETEYTDDDYTDDYECAPNLHAPPTSPLSPVPFRSPHSAHLPISWCSSERDSRSSYTGSEYDSEDDYSSEDDRRSASSRRSEPSNCACPPQRTQPPVTGGPLTHFRLSTRRQFQEPRQAGLSASDWRTVTDRAVRPRSGVAAEPKERHDLSKRRRQLSRTSGHTRPHVPFVRGLS